MTLTWWFQDDQEKLFSFLRLKRIAADDVQCLGCEMFMAFCPLQIKSLCASLLDSNVLVQRNNLEIVLFFFPFYTCLVSHLCSSRGSAGLPRGRGAGGRDPSRFVRRGGQALGDRYPRSAHFCAGGVSIAESSILPWAACEEPTPFENPS